MTGSMQDIAGVEDQEEIPLLHWWLAARLDCLQKQFIVFPLVHQQLQKRHIVCGSFISHESISSVSGYILWHHRLPLCLLCYSK